MTSMPVFYKIFLLSSCFITCFCGTHPDGDSKVSREQDAEGNYQFGYSVSNAEGEHFRQEGTDHLGRVVGSYGLTHSDGTQRLVKYVADKDGFRAEVRSNEPGVAGSERGAAPILSSDPPLVVAATSLDDSKAAFGARLRAGGSAVSYADQNDKVVANREKVDNTVRESRQSNFDDYRPQSPVAYYPRSESYRAPISQEAISADGQERYRSRTPSVDSRPTDVYLPPINPHRALGRPPYDPGDRPEILPPSSTSRRPFIPPYGGFDDDPIHVDRRPTISTIRGGSPIETSTPPSYGSRRYPAENVPLSRDFIRPDFPPSSSFPRIPGSVFPSPPRTISQVPIFGPPSYGRGPAPPNFVLRAVPIPNGIQAVRIDPNTGQVYERIAYPIYLGQDGHSAYDENILLHTEGISDDDALRNDNRGYFPFDRRPPFRMARNQPFDDNDAFALRNRSRNSIFNPRTLSVPTARDLAWIRRQLAAVDGFEQGRFPNPSLTRQTRFANNEDPEFKDFDDRVDDRSEGGDYSMTPFNISAYAEGDLIYPNGRFQDRLDTDDTKDVQISKVNGSRDSGKSEADAKDSSAKNE